MKRLVPVLFAASIVGAFFVGKCQCKTVTEIKTVTVTETKEVIPDNYIPLEKAIPLEDVAYQWVDCEYGYICLMLKDTTRQMDDLNGAEYSEVLSDIPATDIFNARLDCYTELSTK